MVDSKNYPKQGAVKSTNSKTVLFPNCKIMSNEIVSQMKDYYPVETIIDTSMTYIVKAWTNDGVVLITCSEPDLKMLVTVSSYI